MMSSASDDASLDDGAHRLELHEPRRGHVRQAQVVTTEQALTGLVLVVVCASSYG